MQHKKLIPDNETFVKECTDKCIEILSSISNLNAFVPYESSVRNVFYSAAYEPSIPLFEKVKEALLDIIDQQKVALKDNLTSVIENLSDESIEVFKDLIMGSNPYNEASYDLLPIFDKINTDAFINGYLSLSNQNKDVVCEYIGYRYRKFQYSQGIRERLLPDKDNLQVISDKLKIIEQQLKNCVFADLRKYDAENNIYYMSSLLFIPLQTILFNDFYKLRCDENNIWVAIKY